MPQPSVSTRVNRASMLPLALSLGLLIITLVLYWPVRSFDFITAYDDQRYVTENAMVRNGFTFEAFRWAFGSGYASNWHPVTWLSHMLDAQLWGMSAGAHHLVNLVLHAASALLLLVVLRRYTGALWRSTFVAGLFAWHPLHVESVAWIAERKDVLSTFFLMLMLWAYGEYAVRKVRNPNFELRKRRASAGAENARKIFYWLALAAFALGLMSKPMLVTAPFLLLLLDYWPLKRHVETEWVHLVVEKTPFLVLSAASSVVTFLVQQAGGAVASLNALPLSERAANAVVAYVRYLVKTARPEPLAIPYPFTADYPGYIVFGALVLLAGVSAVALALRRRIPWLLVGWFWYVGTLVPVIGLVQVGGQSIADRYTYVPLTGIFVVAVWGFAELSARFKWSKGAVVAVSCAVLVLCVAATSQQLPYWRNSVTLFQHAVAVTTNNATAHVNLGKALAGQGKLQEAFAQYQDGLAIRPADAEALNDVGNLFMRAGKSAAAVEFYRRAIDLKPRDASFHYNLGNAKAEIGQFAAASEAYEQSLKLDPNYALAHTALAVTLTRLGKMQEAWQHIVRSAELDPSIAETHNVLGNFYAAGEKHEQAIAAYREALRLNPRFAGVCLNLGNSLLRLGRTNEAIAALEHGVQLDPSLWQAHGRLAEVYASLGNFPKAIEAAQHGLQVAEQAGLTAVIDEFKRQLKNYRAGVREN